MTTCVFVQFIFISSRSAESIKIKRFTAALWLCVDCLCLTVLRSRWNRCWVISRSSQQNRDPQQQEKKTFIHAAAFVVRRGWMKTAILSCILSHCTRDIRSNFFLIESLFCETLCLHLSTSQVLLYSKIRKMCRIVRTFDCTVILLCVTWVFVVFKGQLIAISAF